MKILVYFITLLIAATYLVVADPATSTPVNIEMQHIKTWSPGTVYDTMVNSSDSVKIFGSIPVDPGWELVIVSNAFSGDSAANAVLQVRLHALSGDGTLMKAGIVDTINTTADIVLLPIGTKFIGGKFDAVIQLVDTLDEIVPSKVELWKRRTVTKETGK